MSLCVMLTRLVVQLQLHRLTPLCYLVIVDGQGGHFFRAAGAADINK